jgi:hypothetical protein
MLRPYRGHPVTFQTPSQGLQLKSSSVEIYVSDIEAGLENVPWI